MIARKRPTPTRVANAGSLPLALLAIFASIFGSIFVSMASAAEPLLRFQHIPPEESFASKWFMDVTQDRDGFIWFASVNGGFARYDGYEFKTYRHDPANPDGLPSNTVHDLYVDPDEDTLWVGMAEGLVAVDLATDDITHFQHDPTDPSSLIHDGVYRILRDGAGNLWVGTERGLSRMGPDRSGFQNYDLVASNDPEDKDHARWVMALHEDARGTLWIGTFGGGLLKYSSDTDSFLRFLHDPEDPASLPGDWNSVRDLYEDSSGRLWVGTDHAAAIMRDHQRGTFDVQMTGAVRDIVEDDFGNLWIATWEGLKFRAPDASEFITFKHDVAKPEGIGPGLVNQLLVDDSGMLWAPGDQISYLPPTAMAFSVIPFPEGGIELPVMQTDHLGQLWVGGKEGLFRLDPATGTWDHRLPYPEAENPEQNHVHRVFLRDEYPEQLWVATGTSMIQFDPITESMTSRDIPATALAFEATTDGELWMGMAFQGLQRLDWTTGEAERFRHDPEDATSISHDYPYFLIEDDDGSLWFGTHSGLNRFDRQSGTAQRYFAQPGDEGSLSNSSIRAGIKDARGRLWFGTDFGLNRYDPVTDRFIRLYNGLDPANNVFKLIREADDGRLWLGTDAGITLFDPDRETFLGFDHADGLPAGFNPDINFDLDGNLYSLAPQGVVRIDTDRLLNTEESVRLSWTGLSILRQGSAETLDTPPPRETLALDHRDQIVTLGFSALGVRDPASVRYGYRLAGFQDQWIETDAQRRTAAFSDLPQGSYALEVRAMGAGGRWLDQTIDLPVIVEPPPWRSMWALLLYALATAALVTTFVTWRTHSHKVRARELEIAVRDRTTQLESSESRVRQQSTDLKRLLAVKERLFANISHEFRTPLTLMLGPIDRAREATGNDVVAAQLTMAKRNGKRVLRLVDQLMELSQLSGELEPEEAPQPLEPVARDVVDAFAPIIRQRGLSLTFTADDTLWTSMPAEAVERILMNLLSNAIKFTAEGGAIQVVIGGSLDGKSVELRVADTGVGIPVEEQENIFERFHRIDSQAEHIPGSGIGLALVHELVDSYGGAIEVLSAQGEGSEFIIRIPRFDPPAGMSVARQAPPSEALKLEIDTLRNTGQAEDAVAGADDAEGRDAPTVLVIDDSADMRLFIAQVVGTEYVVKTADSGRVGLEIASSEVPDLVICDLMMPDMDGFQVTKALRQQEHTSHIPIIMLTARQDDESRIQGLKDQVDEYLVKPFNTEELLLRVSNLLAIRDILRARFGSELLNGALNSSSLREPEHRFISKLQGVLETHYMNADLTIASIASEMAMSERQLQRKLKAISDQTPGLYLRLFRLKRSLRLLEQGERISETAYLVGFTSPAYFSSCFRAQFGCTPSEFQSGDASIQGHGLAS